MHRTTSRRRAAVLAPVLGLALAVSAALPASAASTTGSDARGDVVKRDRDASTQDAEVPAPRNQTADITRLTVRRGEHRVRIIVGIRDLRPSTRGLALDDVDYRIRTPEGDFTARVSSDRRGQRLRTSEGLAEPSGFDAGCSGLTSRHLYRRDVVRLVIPNRCLGHPRWVRVGAQTFRSTRDRTFVDDALAEGRIFDRPRLGPRT